jgi:hypothetical protein
MKTMCIAAAVSLSIVACSRSTASKSENSTATVRPTVALTVTPVSPAAIPIAAGSETADPNGACHAPQYFGEGTIYWESKNVCIVRGKASGLLLARIQATTLSDFNARKAFAELKLVELVRAATLTSSEVCDASNRTGLFSEQADLGGAGDVRLSTDAAAALGCAK